MEAASGFFLQDGARRRPVLQVGWKWRRKSLKTNNSRLHMAAWPRRAAKPAGVDRQPFA